MTATAQVRRLPLYRVFQVGLLFLAQGLLSLLLTGVMNRVMIDESLLAIPATVATACLSVRFFVAIIRVYLGQLTDSRSFLGWQRTGYILVALPLAALAFYAALQIMWQLGDHGGVGWALLLGLMLGIYGVFVFMVAVAGMALVYDIAPADDRGRVMGVVWSMLLMGIVVGGGLGRPLLRDVTLANLQPEIDRFFIIILVAAWVLGSLGVLGVERHYSLRGRRLGNESPSLIGFIPAVRLFLANRQSTSFVGFIFVVTLGVFMQRPILEPYGGEVFGMDLGSTTQLNMIWGLSTLIALVAAGFTLTPKLGPWRTTSIGLVVCGLGFLGIFGAGFLGPDGVFAFQCSVFVMGAGGGISVNSLLGLMLALVPPAHAGLYLGTFGLAQYLAQAFSLIISGAMVDVGRYSFDAPSAGYGVVFLVEAALLFGSTFYLARIERTTPKPPATNG